MLTSQNIKNVLLNFMDMTRGIVQKTFPNLYTKVVTKQFKSIHKKFILAI